MQKAAAVRGAKSGGQVLPQGWHNKDQTAPARKPKTCKHILSYNANALYLSTMLHDMPCGKERVVHYQNWLDAAVMFTERVKAGM